MKVTEEIKQAKAAKNTSGKGFAETHQPSTANKQEPIENGGLMAANGLRNVAAQQCSELGLVAQQLDSQLDQLAEPVANYFADVISGKALITKVLQRMNEKTQPQSLNMELLAIEAPEMPTVHSINAADFFSTPKPIALPGK